VTPGFRSSFLHQRTAGKESRQGDDGDDDECSDPVDALDGREIMEEELHQRHGQQPDARIPGAGLIFPESDHDEGEGEECPGDAVGHVAAKVDVEVEGDESLPCGGEGIRDLDVQKHEQQNATPRTEEAAQVRASPSIMRGF
jgi:hypothetical protein